MHIDISEEAFEPDDDEDNAFARVILQATGNLVEGILENIDIEVEFYEDHTCRIRIDVFGSDDVEYTKWYIDKAGKLYIEDSESFSIDEDDYWLFDDGALVAYDEDGDRMDHDDASIYLLRTER